MKSIFRRKNYEKLYEVMEHYSSYRGKTSLDTWINTVDKSRLLSDEIIATCDLDYELSVGKEFFLDDIQEAIEIKDKMKSSDGSIIYYVKDKYVETENTAKSYSAAVEKMEKNNRLEEDLKLITKEFDDYKREYKYMHRFFNF